MKLSACQALKIYVLISVFFCMDSRFDKAFLTIFVSYCMVVRWTGLKAWCGTTVPGPIEDISFGVDPSTHTTLEVTVPWGRACVVGQLDVINSDVTLVTSTADSLKDDLVVAA